MISSCLLGKIMKSFKEWGCWVDIPKIIRKVSEKYNICHVKFGSFIGINFGSVPPVQLMMSIVIKTGSSVRVACGLGTANR
jgi:hypothetical protein